jgi:hypothetical protein
MQELYTKSVNIVKRNKRKMNGKGSYITGSWIKRLNVVHCQVDQTLLRFFAAIGKKKSENS